ncbi:hypothetical protein PISL3812_02620 [Talaromyces islandicus]|uniref:Transacylase cctO n=1 Tax=Talaromyces islandicus TaxID=28573 RepID=CCTO_TALIS|nr:RecName: Full=Transacylase cctO; AltName: Full=Cyclochlorotine biosynthesis protein O [Talaromyces islandicus]CRG85573.1 hypothetical protein PISL3812_02620 [Talaromyces islandicus]
MPLYSQIRQSEDAFSEPTYAATNELINDNENACPHCRQERSESWFLKGGRSIVYVSLTFFVVSIGLNFILAILLYSKFHASSFQTEWSAAVADTDCVRRLVAYTPALDSIEYFATNLRDAYRSNDQYLGPPTKEREQMWQDLWLHEAIMVETWAMPLLNRINLDPYEKVEGELGDGYNALLQVHHQLGCLDILRQYTWLLSGKYTTDGIPVPIFLQKPPEENRRHVDQCIEELRMGLMCHGDMTPLLITKKRDGASGFKADMNTHYMCRNFTKLQEWTMSHGVEHWELGDGRGPHEHGRR